MKEPSQVIQILLVEDNPHDALLVETDFSRIEADVKYQITTVGSLAAGLRRLTKTEFDAILLDLSLPDSQGLETVIHVLNKAPRTPVLVLSGSYDEELAINIVQAGAQDYLVKGETNREQLNRTVRYAIERKRTEEILRETERRRASHLSALQDLGNELATLNETQAIFDTLVARTAALAESPECLVIMIDFVTNEGVLKASYGIQGNIPTGYRVLLDLPVIQQHISSIEPIFISDVDQVVPELRSVFSREDLKAINAYPMIRNEQVIGYIILRFSSPYIPEEGEIATFQLLSERAVAALENARLLEQTHRLAEQLALVNDIGEEIVHLTDPKSLQELVTQRIVERLGYYSAGIFILEDEQLNFAAGYRQPGSSMDLGLRISLHTGIIGHVASTGTPYLAPDVRKDPYYFHDENLPDTLSELAIPIKSGDRLLGVLDVESRLVGDLTDIDRQVLEAISGQFSTALENAHLFEQTHRLAEQLTLVNDIGEDIVPLTDPKSLLELATQRIVERLGYYFTGIFIQENEGLRYAAGYSRKTGVLKSGRIIPENEGIISFVAKTGIPYLAADVTTDPHYAYYENLPETRCELAIPIRSGNRFLGLLDVESELVGGLDDIDLKVLEALAGQFATALENARLFQELNQSNAELARLYRASGSIISGTSLDLHSQAKNIVETVAQEFGQTNCSLILVSENSTELDRIAIIGPNSEALRRGILTKDGPGLIAKSIRTGQVINFGDVTANPEYVCNWDAARSEMIIPLKIGERVIGAIDLQSSSIDAYSSDDERLMTIFAERVALALEHGRLYEQTVRNLQRLTALQTIDQAISSTIDLRVTLNILLDQIITQLAVDATAILLINPNLLTLEYAAGRGFRTNSVQKTQWRLGEGLAGRSALERKTIMNFGTQKFDEREYIIKNPRFKDENFVSYCAVPLIAKGQVQGVLNIFHRSPLQPDTNWLDFLETLAEQAAIAIDNTKLFENLQRSNAELSMAYDATIEGWSRAMDLRDKETEGHTQRVAELTLRLATSLGISKESLIHIRRGALLHDIGKMGISDTILLKPGPLTDSEMEVMHQHPNYAYTLLSPITYLHQALDIPYCHHEKWEGTGYPRQLKGEQIPLAARLFAVVDVWDALLSDRPYRLAWSISKVVQYIQDQSGMHFDPRIVKTFMNMMNNS